MTQRPRFETRIITVVGIACLCLTVMSGASVAVSNGAVTTLTNSDVEAGQSATHTLTYEADGFSADGETDTIYLQLPDTYAGNLSFSSVEFVNRTSGATVPVSSSTSVVDGPDGDGVQETLKTGISKDADYQTDSINATYEFSLSHPPVDETTSYDVTFVAVDSMTERNEVTATDALTVVAGTAAETSPTATVTATATVTEAPSDTETTTEDASSDVDSTATVSDSSDPTESTETTSTTTPGFGAGMALVALVGTALLLGRRNFSR